MAEGSHSIRVAVNCETKYAETYEVSAIRIVPVSGSSETVLFDLSLPPTVILSLQNATFFSSGVALSLVVDKPTSRIAYSLDGLDDVTIAGNTYLSDLSAGEHSITVYAWDGFGSVGASETVTFTVAEPFPVVTVAVVSIAVIVVASIGLVVYFKKRKR